MLHLIFYQPVFLPADNIPIFLCLSDWSDSRGGVLLLGSTHFYVMEGVTIFNHGELVDMETDG